MTSLLTFPKGGVHPPAAKELTAHLAIEVMPVPDELEIILGQHIGAPCTPTVSIKDVVREGQVIAEVTKGLGVPLHAPVSGIIKGFGMSGHPMRVSAPSITIQTDHAAPAVEYAPSAWQGLSREDLLAKVHGAGIIGIGGAAFSCDLGIYGEVGKMPSILLGPRGDHLHAPDEWVEIQDLLDLTGIYATLAVEWCGS